MTSFVPNRYADLRAANSAEWRPLGQGVIDEASLLSLGVRNAVGMPAQANLQDSFPDLPPPSIPGSACEPRSRAGQRKAQAYTDARRCAASARNSQRRLYPAAQLMACSASPLLIPLCPKKQQGRLTHTTGRA